MGRADAVDDRATEHPVSGGSRGVALPVVLWALVALGGLSIAAAGTARLEVALADRYLDHAAALALAEAGLALSMNRLAAGAATSPDSLTGILGGGAYTGHWSADGAGFRIRAVGSRQGARREVEVWAAVDGAGALQIAAWHEVR